MGLRSVLLVAATLGAIGGAYHLGDRAGYGRRDAEAKTAELAQVQRDLRGTQAVEKVSAEVGQAVEAKAVEIRTRTITLHDRIPVYVTPEADRRCVVPVGFVRLHDAAAQQTDLAATPAEPADAPSGVALSAVGDTVSANYGTCALWANQLNGWIDWYAQASVALERPQDAR